MPTPVKRFKAVGAYIFSGGFTLGVQKHFKVLCHLEGNNYGTATAKRNFPDLPIHIGVENWPLESLRKEQPEFIYGNPPCAAWSSANCKNGTADVKWRTDPRVDCTRRHFQLIMELRPKIWAWESVTQAFSKGREFCDSLAVQAIDLGYSVTYLLHDARWFGLPQIRKRFFMVCHNIEFAPIVPDWLPPPTPTEILAQVTDGGGPCRRVGSCYARRFTPDILKNVKPGERLLAFWKRAMASPDPEQWERNLDGTVKGRPSFGVARLPKDRPGGAVVGYEMIHPTEHRFISTHEMQVLSGFPVSYQFTPPGMSARACEIARGVCPPVGAWLAQSAVKALQNNIPVSHPKVVLADLRQPPGTFTNLDVPQVLEVTQLSQPPVSNTAIQLTQKTRLAPTQRQGIGAFIRSLLRKGQSTDQILQEVKIRFPQSRATKADIAWNQAQIKKGRI